MISEARAFGDFLADLRSERGFHPGLRPRSHASDLLLSEEAPASGELFEPDPEEDEETIVAESDEMVSDADLEEQARALPYRLEEAEAFLRRPPASMTGTEEPHLERQMPPEKRHNRRRIGAVRAHVEAFEPRNAAQRDLLGVLRATLTYMRARLCGPEAEDEFERWMSCVQAFWCALEFPELNGRRSWRAFQVLMDLEPEELLDVARWGHLGHRMPKPKKKKRGRSRKRRRRRRCA